MSKNWERLQRKDMEGQVLGDARTKFWTKVHSYTTRTSKQSTQLANPGHHTACGQAVTSTSAGHLFQWLADITHTVQGSWILFACPNSLAEMITLFKMLEEQWHRIMKMSTQFILILTLRVTKSRGKLRWQQHRSRWARRWRDRGRKAAEAHTQLEQGVGAEE